MKIDKKEMKSGKIRKKRKENNRKYSKTIYDIKCSSTSYDYLYFSISKHITAHSKSNS